MNWKVLLIMCFFAQLSYAQVFVKNSNYVFVEDVALYVEDDVNLKGNNSYLYLRDEAQLLQGSGTTGNSGTGRLSVYQEGTVDQYSYNYWCSPVGNNDADNNANRDFRANDNIYDVTTAPITSSLATYTSSYSGTSSPLVISRMWLYTFSTSTQYSDWNFVGETLGVTPGYGFTMKGTSGSGDNQRYDFRGKPNSGEIRTSVLNNQWTLIGNPYPSALDAAEFIHDTYNTDFTGTLYYWEQDLNTNSHYISDYIGGYASYTTTAPDGMDNSVDSYTPATFTTFDGAGNIVNLPPPGANGIKTAQRYIPVGQGFMIEGNTTGDVRVTNDQRDFEKESGGSSYFFEINNEHQNVRSTNTEGLNQVPEGYMRFRINVDFNDVYTRQLLMNFHDSATEGFDRGLESKHPSVINSDAYWNVNDTAYNIQALPFDDGLRIPLIINLGEQQLVRFRIFDIQRFEENQPIYLHDLETDLYIALNRYNYQLNLEAGLYENRFELVFRSGEDQDLEEEVELGEFLVFQNNETAELTIKNPDELAVKQVGLYDISGKMIFHAEDLSVENHYTFSTANLSEGVYMVNVMIEGGKPIDKKIIIDNK